MLLSILSLLLSGAALWVALRRNAPPPPTAVHRPDGRQQQAVARREWLNFMHYDGTPQPPIDPDRVLGE